MSRQVAPDETTDETAARALARHVSGWLEQKDYSRAWDSAAAVAKSRRGDCTEHAVLTAALCRARGIPARIVYGLVYLHTRQRFGSHAWAEAWIDGEWVGLDATQHEVLIGAGHIKLGDSALAATTAQAAMLPLTRLLSQDISLEATYIEP
jgi:transglutaminase-like putative cysteine protease